MFLAPIGAAIAGGASAVAGAASTLAPIISAAGTAASVVSAFQKPSLPKLQQPPSLPNPAIIESQQANAVLRANQKRTKTILTSPLGVTDTTGSTVQRKQLVAKLGF